MRRELRAEPTVVKVTSPADILGVLPHRLGFHPAESLVVLCLQGPRRRDGLAMRVDLPPPAEEEPLARELADRVRRARATSVLLVCYTDAAATDADAVPGTAPPAPPVLARARLVGALTRRLAGRGVGVAAALLVSSGRWWSYDCADPVCCPWEGTPLDPGLTPAALRYAAVSVLAGGAVLADRATLVAGIEAPQDAVSRGVRARAAAAAGEVMMAEVARGGPAAAGRLGLATLRRLVDDWSRGSCELAPEDAALVAVGLRYRPARDEASTLVLDHTDGLLVAVLTAVVRGVEDDDAGPALTVLAWAAHAQGGGALAAAAAERALRCDPGDTLAQLVLAGLDCQVPPEAIRQISEVTREHLRW